MSAEYYCACLTCGTLLAAGRYWQTNSSTAIVVAEGKTWVWENFEAMERDLWLAL